MKITCPHCHFVFEEADPHRPFRCPKCGSLLGLNPTGVHLIMSIEEMLSGGRV